MEAAMGREAQALEEETERSLEDLWPGEGVVIASNVFKKGPLQEQSLQAGKATCAPEGKGLTCEAGPGRASKRSRTASGKVAALQVEGLSDDDTHVSASCDPDFSSHLDEDSMSSSDDDFESEPDTPPKKKAKKATAPPRKSGAAAKQQQPARPKALSVPAGKQKKEPPRRNVSAAKASNCKKPSAVRKADGWEMAGQVVGSHPTDLGRLPPAEAQRAPLKENKRPSATKRQLTTAEVAAPKEVKTVGAKPLQTGATLSSSVAGVISRKEKSPIPQQAREAVGASPPQMQKAPVALKQADPVHTPIPAGQDLGLGCQPPAGRGTPTPRYTAGMPKRPLHGPGGMGKLNIPAGPAFRVPGLRKGGHKKFH